MSLPLTSCPSDASTASDSATMTTVIASTLRIASPLLRRQRLRLRIPRGHEPAKLIRQPRRRGPHRCRRQLGEIRRHHSPRALHHELHHAPRPWPASWPSAHTPTPESASSESSAAVIIARLRPHFSIACRTQIRRRSAQIRKALRSVPTASGRELHLHFEKRRIHILRAVRERHESRHQQNQEQKRRQKDFSDARLFRIRSLSRIGAALCVRLASHTGDSGTRACT